VIFPSLAEKLLAAVSLLDSLSSLPLLLHYLCIASRSSFLSIRVLRYLWKLFEGSKKFLTTAKSCFSQTSVFSCWDL
jgi:hypothetical protein